MNAIYKGSCLCGCIQFEITGQPGPSGICHCADCRKVTGSAFGVSIRFEESAFRITTGNPLKSYTKTADSGNEITRWFCPECGSPIYTASPVHPGFVYIKAGSLSDPSVIKPTSQSWTDSRVDWAAIDPGIDSYRKGRN